MPSSDRPLTYTEIEIRSYLPSGWGIAAGGAGRDVAQSKWTVEVYDGADNAWTVAVASADAARVGRLPALKAAIERLESKALGRKSVISG